MSDAQTGPSGFKKKRKIQIKNAKNLSHLQLEAMIDESFSEEDYHQTSNDNLYSSDAGDEYSGTFLQLFSYLISSC